MGQMMANDSERREYFRVDDEIAFDYRLIGEQELKQLLDRIQSRLPDRFTASSGFVATSRQMAHAMHKVQTDSPELARCLLAIDQKLNMLAQLFVVEEINLHDQPARQVNISAGGLLFRAQHELPADSLIELRMVLFPALAGILTVSRVSHCNRADDGNLRYPWQVTVEYEHIRESDRELLVRHTMSLQTAQLREQRESDNQATTD